MLNETVQQAINDQINMELVSSYTYLSMAAHFEAINLTGFAHWMRVQSREELSHAMKFFDYIIDRGGRVALQAVAEPQAEFPSLLGTMQQVLEHERKVTASINRLYDLALQQQDYATQNLLQWFVTEQVEEEKSADEIVQHLKLIGDDGAGLYMLDRQLAGRVDEA